MKNYRWISSLFCDIALLLILYSCGTQNSGSISETDDVMQEASLLSISEKEGYDDVIIKNAEGKEVAHYVLVSQGSTDIPNLPEGATVLKVPLENIALDSEVYGAAIEELGGEKFIKGIFDPQHVTSPLIQKGIEEGRIKDLGKPDSPNIERILEMQPDAIMVSYYDGMQMQGIDKTGVPIIKMYDLQEDTPLGRAEWLRFIGRLIGKGEMSDEIYNKVKNNYRDLTKKAADKKVKPKVLTDAMYEGIWFVPGGKSYQARLIEDAGGNYFKNKDNSTSSLSLSAEQVLEGGADADVWLLKVFGNVPTLQSLATEDKIYKEFQPYKTGNIYYSDTSTSNLYREFPFHPDLLLKDYMLIFDAITANTDNSIDSLRYFRKIEN